MLEHKNNEVEALGKVDVPGVFLSFDSTIELVQLLHNHVSSVVSHVSRRYLYYLIRSLSD